jgi:hypothetical protein
MNLRALFLRKIYENLIEHFTNLNPQPPQDLCQDVRIRMGP